MAHPAWETGRVSTEQKQQGSYGTQVPNHGKSEKGRQKLRRLKHPKTYAVFKETTALA